MGVLSLIEKAQETFSREKAEAAQKKLTSSTFYAGGFPVTPTRADESVGVVRADSGNAARRPKVEKILRTADCPKKK